MTIVLVIKCEIQYRMDTLTFNLGFEEENELYIK